MRFCIVDGECSVMLDCVRLVYLPAMMSEIGSKSVRTVIEFGMSTTYGTYFILNFLKKNMQTNKQCM